jgi:hypothetical protein
LKSILVVVYDFDCQSYSFNDLLLSLFILRHNL